MACRVGRRGGKIKNRTDDFSIEDNKDKLVKYVSKKLAGVGRVVDFFMPMNAEAKSEG